MKLGLSSYSLYAAMKEREMTIMDVIDWTANNGGQHIEMVPELGFSLKNNPEFADEIRTKAHDAGIEISNYAIGANFIQGSKEAYSKIGRASCRERGLMSAVTGGRRST